MVAPSLPAGEWARENEGEGEKSTAEAGGGGREEARCHRRPWWRVLRSQRGLCAHARNRRSGRGPSSSPVFLCSSYTAYVCAGACGPPPPPAAGASSSPLSPVRVFVRLFVAFLSFSACVNTQEADGVDGEASSDSRAAAAAGARAHTRTHEAERGMNERNEEVQSGNSACEKEKMNNERETWLPSPLCDSCACVRVCALRLPIPSPLLCFTLLAFLTTPRDPQGSDEKSLHTVRWSAAA